MAPTAVDFVARADGWFEIRSLRPAACLSRFPLHHGFRFDDWLQAALATDQLRLLSDTAIDPPTGPVTAGKKAATYQLSGSAPDLIQTVEKVLEYFDAAGTPGEELSRLRTRMTQWFEDATAVSDYDLAFSDLELRELLADEARNSQDVWNPQTLAIDPRAALETVLQRLLRRTAAQGDQPVPEKSDAGALASLLRTPRKPARNREVG